MLYAGISHLTFNRYEFYAQVPTWLTTDTQLIDLVVLASGVVEIIFGVLMIWGGKLKVQTGLLLGLFFIAVFPGNINQYVNHIDAFNLNTDQARLIRMLFQPVLVAWAWWATGACKALCTGSKCKKD